MEKQNIAIVGLGRVGSAFLEAMLLKAGVAFTLVCVAEKSDTPGKARAVAENIATVDIDQLIALGNKVDIIFDMSGNSDTRKELREKLAGAQNRHTVLAPENVARLIWALVGNGSLPVIEGRKTDY